MSSNHCLHAWETIVCYILNNGNIASEQMDNINGAFCLLIIAWIYTAYNVFIGALLALFTWIAPLKVIAFLYPFRLIHICSLFILVQFYYFVFEVLGSRFYTKHCFHAHNNGIVEGIYRINRVRNIFDTHPSRRLYQKCFEIRKNIDDIPDMVYSVYTFENTIIMSL